MSFHSSGGRQTIKKYVVSEVLWGKIKQEEGLGVLGWECHSEESHSGGLTEKVTLGGCSEGGGQVSHEVAGGKCT